MVKHREYIKQEIQDLLVLHKFHVLMVNTKMVPANPVIQIVTNVWEQEILEIVYHVKMASGFGREYVHKNALITYIGMIQHAKVPVMPP